MVDRPEDDAATLPNDGGLTWRKLLLWSLIWSVVVVAAINVFGGIIPPLLVFAALWIVAAVWLRRSTKGPSILAVVVFLVFLAMSLPFILPTLTVPASAGDFILNTASLIGALVGIVAAIAVLRGGAESASPAGRTILLGAGAIFGLVVVVAVVALVTYDDAAAQDDDVAIVAADLEFDDESIEVDAGEVGVFVENKDSTLHTFTIDELDVDLAIPAGKSARMTFQADPGTYEFYCVPHEYDMKGKLEVR